MLETNKNDQHIADGRGMTGIILGYIGRTIEYIVGTEDAVYKCRTIRRKTEDSAYDPTCVDFLKISYNEYVLRDAIFTYCDQGSRCRRAGRCASREDRQEIHPQANLHWARR